MRKLDRRGLYASLTWLFCITAGMFLRVALEAVMGAWVGVGGSAPGPVALGGSGWVLAISPSVYSIVALSPVAIGGAVALYHLFRSHP